MKNVKTRHVWTELDGWRSSDTERSDATRKEPPNIIPHNNFNINFMGLAKQRQTLRQPLVLFLFPYIFSSISSSCSSFFVVYLF
jgi:hypothetical protein